MGRRRIGLGAAAVALVLASGNAMEAAAETFRNLPAWSRDNQGEAFAAWRRSCTAILDRPLAAHDGARQRVCATALAVPEPVTDAVARAFFERYFELRPVIADGREAGLFTGYFEPELDAAETASPDYPEAILAPPDGLVGLDGGARPRGLAPEFTHALRRAGTLVALPDRAAIEAGELGPAAPVLAWLRSPVDAFFLHVQGSGRLRFAGGRTVRVAYAGRNGHPYTSIGRLLVDRGLMSRDEVSMQSLKVWLQADPERGRALMRENRSYIFFRRLPVDDPALGPVGQQGIPLTPGRSLAVDLAHHAPGSLLWLETVIPGPGGEGAELFSRLMVAQDTGSAIRGAVRGDIFFGTGDAAGARAGRMRAEGRLVALVPKR
jgi:membrane-bound lytic murein transglycosylase A